MTRLYENEVSHFKVGNPSIRLRDGIVQRLRATVPPVFSLFIDLYPGIITGIMDSEDGIVLEKFTDEAVQEAGFRNLEAFRKAIPKLRGAWKRGGIKIKTQWHDSRRHKLEVWVIVNPSTFH